MDSMYWLYLGIVVLAFIVNIVLVTQGNQPKSEVGIAPIIQAVMAVPLLLISAAVFYFTKNTSWGINAQGWFICLPFILEILYFSYTKDLFSILKSDTDGFLIRSYLYAIALSTLLVYFFHWVFWQ